MAIRTNIQATGSDGIQTGSITESKIAAGAIDAEHFKAGAAGSMTFLYDYDVQDGIHTRNEVQTLTITATGGTFTAAWDGGTASSALAEDITSADLQTAIRALHADVASVTVTGDGPHTITFVGAAVAGQAIGLTRLLFDGALLTGGAATATAVVATAGNTGVKTLTNLTGGAQVLPDNAVVTDAWIQGVTTATSSGSATIKVGITDDDDAFTPATAYGNGEFTADIATISGTTLPRVLDGDNSVTATISTAALTAGKFIVIVDFKAGL